MQFVFFEPDVLLPAQLVPRRAVCGEERLMLAMLQDALVSVQKYAFAKDAISRCILSEADSWIRCCDREWPFSFENVCDVLLIDPAYVRRKIACWRSQHVPARRSRRRA